MTVKAYCLLYELCIELSDRRKSTVYHPPFLEGNMNQNFLAVAARVMGERSGTVLLRKNKTKDSLD